VAVAHPHITEKGADEGDPGGWGVGEEGVQGDGGVDVEGEGKMADVSSSRARRVRIGVQFPEVRSERGEEAGTPDPKSEAGGREESPIRETGAAKVGWG
jgi:hypothetical protein